MRPNASVFGLWRQICPNECFGFPCSFDWTFTYGEIYSALTVGCSTLFNSILKALQSLSENQDAAPYHNLLPPL